MPSFLIKFLFLVNIAQSLTYAWALLYAYVIWNKVDIVTRQVVAVYGVGFHGLSWHHMLLNQTSLMLSVAFYPWLYWLGVIGGNLLSVLRSINWRCSNILIKVLATCRFLRVPFQSSTNLLPLLTFQLWIEFFLSMVLRLVLLIWKHLELSEFLCINYTSFAGNS